MREKEDGPWSDAGYVAPERHSLLHQPSLKTGLPSLNPKSLFRLQEDPHPSVMWWISLKSLALWEKVSGCAEYL